MNNEIANSPAARRHYIESWVDKLYDEKHQINYLFPEPITQFKQYALDLFLNANLSYEQIADNFEQLITQRKKDYIAREKIKKEQNIRNVVDTIYKENEGLFEKGLEEVQKEYVDLYLNDNTKTIEEIRNILLQSVLELKRERIDSATPIQIEEQHNMVNEPINSEELNNMIADSINEKIEVVKEENNIQKQYVNKKSEKQTGAISIMNIVLVILGIAAFVLIAMILNLLLK